MGGTLASAKLYGAILCRELNTFLRNLLHIHTSHKINTIIELPGKYIWDKVLFDTCRLSPDDDIYFVFYEGFRLAYSKNYLAHLKSKYKNCRLIFCFRNPIFQGEKILFAAQKYEVVRKYYDLCITFNRADAAKMGILFCDYWPCLLPDKDFEPEDASDVFFCGAAKDRLHRIIEVYEKLADSGLKCDFYVTGVPKYQQKYPQEIHYTVKEGSCLDYDEVLQKDRNTKCVLEILPYNQNYSSLRVCEALWYHRKLLTTNLEAPQEWFYHPEIVQCFSEAQDIDTEFITRPLSSEDEQKIFGEMNIGDFGVFADWIIEHAG